MTRGTIYLLLPDNEVIETCEFNGDMYEEGGHMAEVVERLKRVKNEEDFRKEITEFDLNNHNYQKDKDDYFRFTKRNLKFYSEEGDRIDMSRHYFKIFFSDYLYFLNLSGRDILAKEKGDSKVVTDEKGAADIIEDESSRTSVIKDGEIKIFNYGQLYEPKDKLLL